MAEKISRAHGSPYDRGAADSWYRRGRSPHWYPKGTYHGEKITTLSKAEIAEYNVGYDEGEASGDHKSWD